MIFLPARAPFSVYDMSSWSRTIFVPLSILWAKQPGGACPPRAAPRELFHGAPGSDPPPALRPAWGRCSPASIAASSGPSALPGAARCAPRAIDRAAAWMIARFEGSDGLSAILPAMANAALALACLGHAARTTRCMRRGAGRARRAPAAGRRRRAAHAAVPVAGLGHGARLPRAGAGRGCPRGDPAPGPRGVVVDREADPPAGRLGASQRRPPGGWYFEHRNELYPDVDDTCMALMVLRQARADAPEEAQAAAIARGLAWMLGMQNRDGGWASFDRGQRQGRG